LKNITMQTNLLYSYLNFTRMLSKETKSNKAALVAY
jgi:hypothetical protein